MSRHVDTSLYWHVPLCWHPFKLKDETLGAITELREANINSVMITGDNLLTAIAVGEECGIYSKDNSVILPDITNGVLKWRYYNSHELLDEIQLSQDEKYIFALTGSDLKWITQNRPDLINYIMVHGRIFARVNPDEKAEIVERYEVKWKTS